MSELSIYLQTKYKNKMLEILNNQDLTIVEREFYSESPNWYTNQDINSMIDTLLWLTMNYKQKINILDKDLTDYFK
tara:strand:+ start:119 stop:346 length:228 start_codon:yes stop_codon:yes gene_type:complete